MTSWDLLTSWSIYGAHYCAELTVLGPKCHSVECLQPVASRVHWVTGVLSVCSVCTERWRRVAHALGMALHVEVTDYTLPGLDDAEQRFAMMELE